MVKEFLMKKLLISLGVFACVTVNAQTATYTAVSYDGRWKTSAFI